MTEIITMTNHGKLSEWHLADPTTNSKGQKTCLLTCNQNPITFHLGTKLRTRFGASSFDKTVDLPRKSLDFDISNQQHQLDFLKSVDAWAIDYIFENQQRFNFKKSMSREAIREAYKPLTSCYGTTTSIKTKINVRGTRVCQCWDTHSSSIDLPQDGEWLENLYDVQVVFTQLYFMNGLFGLTVETTALRVHPIERVCPF